VWSSLTCKFGKAACQFEKDVPNTVVSYHDANDTGGLSVNECSILGTAIYGIKLPYLDSSGPSGLPSGPSLTESWTALNNIDNCNASNDFLRKKKKECGTIFTLKGGDIFFKNFSNQIGRCIKVAMDK